MTIWMSLVSEKAASTERRSIDAPFTLVVDDELEDAVPVRDAERDRVLAGLAGDGGERGADVRVEHRELELEVRKAGVGDPF